MLSFSNLRYLSSANKKMPTRHQDSRPNAIHGFTLVEMSIVLVVIGLLVGGILVGVDLIEAANLRATVSQIEKYNAAVNAFSLKYNGLPGDLSPAYASAFGLATRAGTTGRGDGNALLEGATSGGTRAAGETALFWNDLSTAGLVDGSFRGTDCAGGASGDCAGAGGGNPIRLSQLIPPAKLGRGNYITVFSSSGFNYYALVGNLLQVGTDGAYYDLTNGSVFGSLFGLTPQQAYFIDGKLDDGNPTTGKIVSILAQLTWGPGVGLTGPAAAGNCGNTDTTPTSYNTIPPNRDAMICAISIRAGF
jgi:prepilin-type N-terminal cleavage/methylation domain-containing protein